MAPRDALTATLGEDLRSKVQNAKILVVGAGGIGCELVKNLVLSGFVNIHLIDLDTIDVSNLNRQFLFRSHHVGQPKALVAKEIALSFNPKASITAHHGNIKSSQFGIDYFEQFALVLNALDNVDARKHVNRLCLATNTPLIESGTTGYLGQVSVIKKGETECYECTDKVTQKVYPICTIRSTPDKMVHCVVWAKECYKLLFGKTEDSMLWEDQSGEEKSAFMDQVTRAGDMAFDAASLLEYAQGVFRGLFELEIEKKLEMKVYKTASKTPQPLVLEEILGAKLLQDLTLDDVSAPKEQAKVWNDRDVWRVAECTKRFFSCIVKMLQSDQARAHLGSYEFDKDDAIAMEFVTAAANLRAAVFNIAMESLYSCKGIAGNIIPAIATTNAIVAGIQVLEAFKILHAAKPIAEACNYTYCNRSWDSRGVLLNPVALSKPNPKCYVCSKHMLELAIDTKKASLRDLVDKVLKMKLGVNEPTVSIGSNTIYEEGEDAEESLAVNLNKLLVNLPGKGIHHETMISIEDFSQDFRCSIRVLHRDEADFGEKATELFALGGDVQKLSAAAAVGDEESKDGEVEDDDSDIEVVESHNASAGAGAPTVNGHSKRVRDADDDGDDEEVELVEVKRSKAWLVGKGKHTPKQTQGKRRSEKLLMGDLKIATVSTPPLGPGDANAADAVRKHSPTPDSSAVTADDSSNASNNSSATSSPAVEPLAAVSASAAKELVVVGTNTTDSAADNTMKGDVCVVPRADALDDIVGDSSEETGDANDPSRSDANGAAGAVVVVTGALVSDESDAVVTDENESASTDEPPVSAVTEDPVEHADAEGAAVENGDAEEKAPQSDVHRKRKRSKRLGFSGSRPKQKRQSACLPLQVQLPDSHENGHADAPESPIFHESAVLYPSAPSEGMAWDWSMSNVYYNPLTQENLDHLVRARKSCANIIAANVKTCKGMQQANLETAHLTAMLKDANDAISSRVRPMRRGRCYRDVWNEEDFLYSERKRDSHLVDKKRGFSDQVALLSNHELVHGYDDELFERYVSKLEAKAGHLSTPTADLGKGGAGSSSLKSDTSSDTKPEPTRKGAKQKQQKQPSLQENVVPDIPLDQCHPAAWGNWIIKKQTTSIDIVHPASLCRKEVSRRWKEESAALEQLKMQQESAAENDDEDEDEAEFDTTRPLAEQRIASIATSMWGNGKDDVTKLPSFGTVLEEDEISREISGSLAKLIPLSMCNWRLAQTVYERAATYAQCSSVLEQEAALAKRIEELYQRLYPARENDSDDAVQDGRVPVFHSRHADLIAHSLKFCRDSEESQCVAASVEYALTLQVGDEVDVLDRNGCWNDGVVVEVFREHGRLVKYVLLRFSLWDTSAVEWVSVTEGRVLPRGVADAKMSFTVGPTRLRKRRIEFNRALADMLEKTFSVRHVEQNAAAAARKVELTAASSSEHAEDAKLQKKKARRGV